MKKNFIKIGILALGLIAMLSPPKTINASTVELDIVRGIRLHGAQVLSGLNSEPV